MTGFLVSPNYKPLELQKRDHEISLIAWGFTLGFGYLVAWKGYKQTSRIPRRKRFKSMYFWLIWGEVISVFGYGCLTWLHVSEYVGPSFWLFLGIWVFWTVQTNTQSQIIINRIAVIIVDKRQIKLVRRWVFAVIMVLCFISAFTWIGASLQINSRFIRGEEVHTRLEGVIFICIDIFLNLYFIKSVKKHLLEAGLEKYRPLTNFVIGIICISIGVDIVVVGMMSYHNPRIWLQFHPLGFIIKLNIELSMADLIRKIARKNDLGRINKPFELSQNNAFSDFTFEMQRDTTNSTISKPPEVLLDIDSLRSRNISTTGSSSDQATSSTAAGATYPGTGADDDRLPEERDWEKMQKRRHSHMSCLR
ncbi:uncharacterized protein H6S33_005400 [Morchella sextelata]|uniref:uncharacterized protein n=1 Tax=Morchella sextelata TaxID=1174677 RepID=UPI001D040B6C|nr:uncharacterized protein H6S33_005400 [Morchella sextelata]KAH0613514.1 hypothetical protein H6S33_005400 [Morchella sextelata]